MKSCYLQRQGIQLVVILVFAVSLILRYISLTSSSAHEHLVVLDDSVSSLPHKTLVCKRGEEKRNLVYLKMHKTGSETLAQLFRRFGYARNLSFVLPSDEGVFGINWPFQVEPKSYRKSKTGQFNILCEHAVLNITTFMALMPKDTVYITSVREPFDRFLSAFNYFRVPLWINMTGSQHERQFMTNPDYFDELYKRRCLRGVTCWPSLLRNAMAFDLGFRVGFPYGSVDWTWDSKRTDHWLTQLDQTLDVIIVVEHFDESLVLLRRRMCWTTSDIIYLQRNPSKHKAREAFSNSSSESNSVIDKYYAWSAVDVQLYKRLSEKFVRQVRHTILYFN